MAWLGVVRSKLAWQTQQLATALQPVLPDGASGANLPQHLEAADDARAVPALATGAGASYKENLS